VFGKSALAAWLRDKRPRSPPSIAQAVQAVPFRVTPWHRFLATFDGSSCEGEVYSAVVVYWQRGLRKNSSDNATLWRC